MLTEHDRQEILARGISPEEIDAQIEIFKKGIPPVKLLRPCTAGDGITIIEEAEQQRLIEIYRQAMAAGRAMKFVPASGAATRMFQLLLEVSAAFPSLEGANLRAEAEKGNEQVRAFLRFFAALAKFPFFEDLKEHLRARGRRIERLLEEENYREILAILLEPGGMNYANTPKALIKFHQYEDGARTPFEEHLVEAAGYTRDRNGVARIHFTVSFSPDHETEELACLESLRERYEQREGVKYELTFSSQKPSTDTIAVDLQNYPVREHDGRLHFRPGGHGALLENLNDLQGDVIFIKNIDNVVPDRLKPPTYHYKMVLGGCLVELQRQVFEYLRLLEAGNVDDALIARIAGFAARQLSIEMPAAVAGGSREERAAFLFSRLNRPLRVCGMVANKGEPGGGPFWVEQPGRGASRQLVEASQIDAADPRQRKILESSTHFSPVDLVCGVRDYRGNPFDLRQFRDPHSGFISRKSKNGWTVKALELPGLWNGSMAYWNTVFVEVPIITFNPVKAVFDLLRPEHQPA